MRIISGQYKHRLIQPPSNFKARPTTDLAKESLFNILENTIDFEQIKVLDLFGGTGGISYEFASRGCTDITCIELNYNHFSFIKKTAADLKMTGLKVIRANVLKFLPACAEKFDLIFADPPYDLPQLPEIPKMVIDNELLADGGLFIMEHSEKNNFDQMPQFYMHKHYGAVNFSFFRNSEGE
ncbi:MAG: RsmD family RNA methyltransferase [Salinivirgaceae bacterium]|nr:RsmD family RNA methyltransferase [Salinivirgaceae bacterium]